MTEAEDEFPIGTRVVWNDDFITEDKPARWHGTVTSHRSEGRVFVKLDVGGTFLVAAERLEKEIR